MEEKNNEELKNVEVKEEEVKNEVPLEDEKKPEAQTVVKEAEVVNNSNNGNSAQSGEGNTKGMATASLVCSLIGLIIMGIPLGIVALITGIIAVNKEDAEETNSKGIATAGIIIGAIDVVWAFFGTFSLFRILF